MYVARNSVPGRHKAANTVSVTLQGAALTTSTTATLWPRNLSFQYPFRC